MLDFTFKIDNSEWNPTTYMIGDLQLLLDTSNGFFNVTAFEKSYKTHMFASDKSRKKKNFTFSSWRSGEKILHYRNVVALFDILDANKAHINKSNQEKIDFLVQQSGTYVKTLIKRVHISVLPLYAAFISPNVNALVGEFMRNMNFNSAVDETKSNPIANSQDQPSQFHIIVRERLSAVLNNWSESRINILVDMLVLSLKSDLNPEPFPIYLDDLAELLEYGQKNHITDLVKKYSENSYWIRSFRRRKEQKEDTKSSISRSKDHIYISVDLAKKICMRRNNNSIGELMFDYFLLMEKLVKDYLRNPDTSVLSFLREEIKSREPGLLEQHSQQKVIEMQLQNKFAKQTVFYFVKIGEMDGGVVYKPGLAADITERLVLHRRSFGNQIVLLDCLSLSHLDYRMTKDFDTRVKAYFQSMNIMYPIPMADKKDKKSSETIMLRDRLDIAKIISFVKIMIPDATINIELEKYKLELAFKLDMKRLELGL